jgi:hypothetical protein
MSRALFLSFSFLPRTIAIFLTCMWRNYWVYLWSQSYNLWKRQDLVILSVERVTQCNYRMENTHTQMSEPPLDFQVFSRVFSHFFFLYLSVSFNIYIFQFLPL